MHRTMLPLGVLLAGCVAVPHPPPVSLPQAAQPLDKGTIRPAMGASIQQLDSGQLDYNYLGGSTLLSVGAHLRDDLSLNVSGGMLVLGQSLGAELGWHRLQTERLSLTLTTGLSGSIVKSEELYSSVAPSAGLNSHYRLTPWLAIPLHLRLSYSQVRLWESRQSGDRALWLEPGSGLLLGRPEGVQCSLGGQLYMGAAPGTGESALYPAFYVFLSRAFDLTEAD